MKRPVFSFILTLFLVVAIVMACMPRSAKPSKPRFILLISILALPVGQSAAQLMVLPRPQSRQILLDCAERHRLLERFQQWDIQRFPFPGTWLHHPWKV